MRGNENLEQVWNQSFSRLGKFDENDIAFDQIFYQRVKNKIERWEQVGRLSSDNMNIELDSEIDMKELQIAMKKLKRGKAAGDDGCLNEILKNGGIEMKNSLLALFREFWDMEQVPVDWARGVIVPIYKDGDRSIPENYRGITLLSVVGKLYSTILNNRLREWLERNNKNS